MLDIVKQINIKQSNGTYLEKPIGVDYDKIEGITSILNTLSPLDPTKDETLTTFENAQAAFSHVKDTYFWIKINNSNEKSIYLCYALKQINVLDSFIEGDNFQKINLTSLIASGGGGGGSDSDAMNVIRPFNNKVDETFSEPNPEGIYTPTKPHQRGSFFWIKFTSTGEQKLIFTLDHIIEEGTLIYFNDDLENNIHRNVIEQKVTSVITSLFDGLLNGVSDISKHSGSAIFEYMYIDDLNNITCPAKSSHYAYEPFWFGVGWDPSLPDEEQMGAYAELKDQNLFYLVMPYDNIEPGDELKSLIIKDESDHGVGQIVDLSFLIQAMLHLEMGGLASFLDVSIDEPRTGDLLMYEERPNAEGPEPDHRFVNISTIDQISGGDTFLNLFCSESTKEEFYVDITSPSQLSNYQFFAKKAHTNGTYFWFIPDIHLDYEDRPNKGSKKIKLLKAKSDIAIGDELKIYNPKVPSTLVGSNCMYVNNSILTNSGQSFVSGFSGTSYNVGSFTGKISDFNKDTTTLTVNLPTQEQLANLAPIGVSIKVRIGNCYGETFLPISTQDSSSDILDGTIVAQNRSPGSLQAITRYTIGFQLGQVKDNGTTRKFNFLATLKEFYAVGSSGSGSTTGATNYIINNFSDESIADLVINCDLVCANIWPRTI